MPPNLGRIPKELIAIPQWVCWRADKTPVNPLTGANAKANDPTTWGEFNQAVHYWDAHKDDDIAGIGYEFSADDSFAGVDLDRCRNAETGEIEEWAWKIIKRLNSYTEISPSGRGVHIIIKGTVPTGGNKKGQVEMYSQRHYFTMSGLHLEGSPATIEERQAELMVLHSEIFGPKEKEAHKGPHPSHTLVLTSSEIIAKAQAARNGRKFERLWNGIWQGDYRSPSEADLALCSMLAYWIGPDPGRIDLLFRQSGLFRKDKWDRRTGETTYGARTIAKAISSCRAFT